MATVTVHRPRCNSDKVYRHGRSCSQHERFRCRSCKRVFQLTYSYEARKPGFKGKRAARTVLTGMCYSVGSATRQGSSS
uniref:IS1 family transposase n=2 Tax=Escherichia coli TaxID=562 RepID=UPI00313E44A7